MRARYVSTSCCSRDKSASRSLERDEGGCDGGSAVVALGILVLRARRGGGGRGGVEGRSGGVVGRMRVRWG